MRKSFYNRRGEGKGGAKAEEENKSFEEDEAEQREKENGGEKNGTKEREEQRVKKWNVLQQSRCRQYGGFLRAAQCNHTY